MTGRCGNDRASRRSILAIGAAGVLCLAWTPGARSQDLPQVINTVKGSVLPVGTYSATNSPRFGFRGTGFVIADGTLLATNFHVLPPGVELASGPTVVVMVARNDQNGTLKRARVVATDRVRDLALLRFEGEPLPTLKLSESGAIEGQSIALMGYPIAGTFGFSPVTHRGIIASVTSAALPAATAQTLDPRTVRRLRDGGNLEVLQLDATAYPGNSGGPVFDAATGQVLGIVNQVLVRGSRESALTNPTGITYAVPVKYLQELLKDVR